jgi:hypothetical protein
MLRRRVRIGRQDVARVSGTEFSRGGQRVYRIRTSHNLASHRHRGLNVACHFGTLPCYFSSAAKCPLGLATRQVPRGKNRACVAIYYGL